MSTNWLSEVAAVSEGGSTWLGDAWGGTKSFLGDGLNIYKDYLTVTGQSEGYEIPAGMSYDQFAEKYGPAPDSVQTMQAAPSQPASGGQWIGGVDNSVVMLAGAAVLLVVLLK